MAVADLGVSPGPSTCVQGRQNPPIDLGHSSPFSTSQILGTRGDGGASRVGVLVIRRGRDRRRRREWSLARPGTRGDGVAPGGGRSCALVAGDAPEPSAGSAGSSSRPVRGFLRAGRAHQASWTQSSRPPSGTPHRGVRRRSRVCRQREVARRRKTRTAPPSPPDLPRGCEAVTCVVSASKILFRAALS